MIATVALLLAISLPTAVFLTVALGLAWIGICTLVFWLCFRPGAPLGVRSPIVRRPQAQTNERDRL